MVAGVIGQETPPRRHGRRNGARSSSGRLWGKAIPGGVRRWQGQVGDTGTGEGGSMPAAAKERHPRSILVSCTGEWLGLCSR